MSRCCDAPGLSGLWLWVAPFSNSRPATDVHIAPRQLPTSGESEPEPCGQGYLIISGSLRMRSGSAATGPANHTTNGYLAP